MTKSGLLSISFALWLAACSAGEPGEVARAEEDAPPAGTSVILAATPPMGFNTWNRFGCHVSEVLVRGMADGTPVLVMQGRLHPYENLPAAEMLLPTAVLA